ncbi:MAG: hypothetical protein ABWY39_11790 [Mycobacterium sp.]
MEDVNWWLMALSFLLGLLLTFALMIRRVTREVPVTESVGVGGPSVARPTVERDTGTARLTGETVTPEGPTTRIPAAGAAAAGAAAAKFTTGTSDTDATAKISAVADEPYGAGSVRAGAGGSGPSGWTIKGNEDSMLYHTTDSPSYKQTIAEVWFREESAAERAGFTRWDKGRARGGAAKFADVPPGPHGPGSALPNADGSGPSGWTVKGNQDSMLYHSPASPAYDVIVAEVWFRDEDTARAAGFARWDSGKSQRGQK